MDIVKFKYDTSDVRQLVKRYPKASREAMTSQVTEAVNMFEAEVKKDTPYGAGPIHLRDTIHGKVVSMGMRVMGTIGTPLEYGEPVELGTKPHFPPIGPIQHWVEAKLQVSTEKSKSVAFLIARKISRKGTKGALMFQKAFDFNIARARRILGRIPQEILRRIRRNR